MLPTVRDIRRSLPPGSPPLGYHFRKWYGRPMSRQQEAILFCLEKQRVIGLKINAKRIHKIVNTAI